MYRLLFFVLCVLNSPVFGQTISGDSLLTIKELDNFKKALLSFEKNSRDSLRIDWHLNRAKEAQFEAEKAQQETHLLEALLLANQPGLTRQLIKTKIVIADRLRVSQEADSSRKLLNEALELSLEIKDKDYEGLVNYNIASLIEHTEQDPVKAISFLHKAQGIFEITGNEEQLAKCHMLMGILHSNDDNPQEAKKYYLLAYAHYIRTGNTKSHIKAPVAV